MASSIFVTNVVDQFKAAEIEINGDGNLVVKDQTVAAKVMALLNEGRPVSFIIGSPAQSEPATGETDATESTTGLSRKTNKLGC